MALDGRKIKRVNGSQIVGTFSVYPNNQSRKPFSLDLVRRRTDFGLFFVVCCTLILFDFLTILFVIWSLFFFDTDVLSFGCFNFIFSLFFTGLTVLGLPAFLSLLVLLSDSLQSAVRVDAFFLIPFHLRVNFFGTRGWRCTGCSANFIVLNNICLRCVLNFTSR